MNYSELLRRGKEEFSSASDRLRAILSDTARALLISKKLAKPDAEKYYISSKVAADFVPCIRHALWNFGLLLVYFHYLQITAAKLRNELIPLLSSHRRRNCRRNNTERKASRQVLDLHTSHQQHQPAASQSLALHRHDSWQAAGHWSPAADDVTEGRNDPKAAASWEYLPLWDRLEWWWRHQWERPCGLLTAVLWHLQNSIEGSNWWVMWKKAYCTHEKRNVLEAFRW